MRYSADDFAALSNRHTTAANHSPSLERRDMHLAIAHHYAEVAALKAERSRRA